MSDISVAVSIVEPAGISIVAPQPFDLALDSEIPIAALVIPAPIALSISVASQVLVTIA